MMEGAWAARRRARERLALGPPDPAALARVDRVLATAFEKEIAASWHSRERSLVSALLGIGARSGVPSLGPVLRRAELRLRLYWPVWRMAAAVWDAAPESLRVRLRRHRGERKAAA
jgi:hypothetical protein